MRLLILALLLAGLLPATTAALPQPDGQDWKVLSSTVYSLIKRYGMLVERSGERVKSLPGEIKSASPSRTEEMKRTLTDFQALQGRGKQALAELKAIGAEVKGAAPAGRTRARYLQLRRQVKTWQVQLATDERSRYYGGYETFSYRDLARVAEERVAAARTLPPEAFIPAGPKPRGLALEWETLPRLDGSTTAQPLSTLILCRLLGLGAVWQYRHIWDAGGEAESPERFLVPRCAGSPLPAAGSTAGSYESRDGVFPGFRLELALTGTNNAYRNLALGSCDFIIVARPPSADEAALAKEKGVGFASRAIGLDAFIFILNSANPVTNLTTEQIRQLYQDNVLRWSEVGGNGEKVVVFQRERNSGSQETMLALVMKGVKMAPSVEQLLEQGMGGPYNRLQHEKNGIGYTFYYYHTVQSPVNRALMTTREGKPPVPPIKICAVDGVLPTAETIRSRAYPFATEVYAVIRADAPPESPAARLRDWLLTPEGQALVAESGYVPLPEP